MELIYVTSLINKETNKKIYIMIDPETGYKFLSSDKDNYVPYYDEELLDELNKDAEYYEKKDNLKKIIAISGVLNTISLTLAGITLIKQMSNSNMDYVLRREVPGYFTRDNIDYNNVEEFNNEFARNVSINQYYSSKEAEIIKAGGSDFLYDWGYLFSEKQKKDLLYGIRSFKIDREAEFESSQVVGTYYEGQIKIKEDHHNVLTTTHEVIHGIFRHSSNSRRKFLFGFGRSMDEAMTATINAHYFEPYAGYETEESYNEQRKDLFKLSLLIDDTEAIMNSQLFHKEDIFDLVHKACPNIPLKDLIRYFSMLDTAMLSIKNDKYTLDNNFEHEMDELYRKMYQDKYGKELPEDIVFLSNDFLSDNVKFYIKSYPCIYEMPRELFKTIKDYENIDPYFITGYMSGKVDPLLLLCTEEEKEEFQKDNECIAFLHKKYSNNKEDLDKFMNCLILNDDDFIPYFELYIDYLNKNNFSSEEFIERLNVGLNTFFRYVIDKDTEEISEDDYRAKHYRELEEIIKNKSISSETLLDFYLEFDNNLRLNTTNTQENIRKK